MKLFGSPTGVTFSPIVTIEPRRRKFHCPIRLKIPLPSGYRHELSSNLHLLCSITGGPNRAVWEDVTGSTPLSIVDDCLIFTTTVSARFWLVFCRNQAQCAQSSQFASQIYRHLISVPFMAKFVIFAKRRDINEANIRVFCMTDDKEERTLEVQEHYSQVAKSRDVEVLEGQTLYLEFGGNLLPTHLSAGRSSSALINEQLAFSFHAFQENRLAFAVRLREVGQEAGGRIAFMEDSIKYLASLNAQQRAFLNERRRRAVCTLGVALPAMCVNHDNILGTPKRNSYYASSRIGDLMLTDIAQELEQAPAASDGTRQLDQDSLQGVASSDWIELAPLIGIPRDEVEFIADYCAANEQASSGRARVSPALILLMHWYKLASPDSRDQDLARALVGIGREDIAKRLNFPIEPKKMSRSTMELLREIELIPVRSTENLYSGASELGAGSELNYSRASSRRRSNRSERLSSRTPDDELQARTRVPQIQVSRPQANMDAQAQQLSEDSAPLNESEAEQEKRRVIDPFVDSLLVSILEEALERFSPDSQQNNAASDWPELEDDSLNRRLVEQAVYKQSSTTTTTTTKKQRKRKASNTSADHGEELLGCGESSAGSSEGGAATQSASHSARSANCAGGLVPDNAQAQPSAPDCLGALAASLNHDLDSSSHSATTRLAAERDSQNQAPDLNSAPSAGDSRRPNKCARLKEPSQRWRDAEQPPVGGDLESEQARAQADIESRTISLRDGAQPREEPPTLEGAAEASFSEPPSENKETIGPSVSKSVEVSSELLCVGLQEHKGFARPEKPFSSDLVSAARVCEPEGEESAKEERFLVLEDLKSKENKKGSNEESKLRGELIEENLEQTSASSDARTSSQSYVTALDSSSVASVYETPRSESISEEDTLVEEETSEMVSMSVEPLRTQSAAGVSSDGSATLTPNTEELEESSSPGKRSEGEEEAAEPDEEQLRRILTRKRLSEGCCSRFGSASSASFVTRKNSLHMMVDEMPPLTEGEPMKHMSYHMSQSIDGSSGSSGSLRHSSRSSLIKELALKRNSQDENNSCSSSTSLERSPVSRRRSSTASQCSSILSEGTRGQLNFDLSPDLPLDSTLLEANALSPTRETPDLELRPLSPEPSSLSGDAFDLQRAESRMSAEEAVRASPDSTLGDSNDNEVMEERLARLTQSCAQQMRPAEDQQQQSEMLVELEGRELEPSVEELVNEVNTVLVSTGKRTASESESPVTTSRSPAFGAHQKAARSGPRTKPLVPQSNPSPAQRRSAAKLRSAARSRTQATPSPPLTELNAARSFHSARTFSPSPLDSENFSRAANKDNSRNELGRRNLIQSERENWTQSSSTSSGRSVERNAAASAAAAAVGHRHSGSKQSGSLCYCHQNL